MCCYYCSYCHYVNFINGFYCRHRFFSCTHRKANFCLPVVEMVKSISPLHQAYDSFFSHSKPFIMTLEWVLFTTSVYQESVAGTKRSWENWLTASLLRYVNVLHIWWFYFQGCLLFQYEEIIIATVIYNECLVSSKLDQLCRHISFLSQGSFWNLYQSLSQFLSLNLWGWTFLQKK